MKKFLLIGAVLASFGSTHAYALTDLCFSPDQSCTFTGEQKIFLDKADGVTTGSGNVGSQNGLPAVQFVSSVSSDFANGFATVKPSDKDTPITTFDISIPGHTFGDILWDVQMFNTKVKDATFAFSAFGYLGGVLQDSWNFTGLNHDADLSFGAVGLDGGQIDELFLTTTTGFKELKHFQISGIDGLVIIPVTPGVPEASTWAMGLIGFAALAGFGLMRGRRGSAVSAA